MKKILSIGLSLILVLCTVSSLGINAYAASKPKATSISTITATPAGFKITWKKVKDVSGYQITYSTNSKFKKAKTLKIKGASSVSKTISKLSSQKKYYVKIRTYKTQKKKTVYSSYSKAKSVTTRHKNEAAPTSIQSISAQVKGFKVMWKKVSAATGYEIQYALKSDFSNAKTVKVSGAKTVSKTVKSLNPNKKYYVRIRTYRKVNKKTYNSPWCSKKAVTTKPEITTTTAKEEEKTAYLFTYFTGNEQAQQSIHFAVSLDGYNYKPLNGNNAVITQKLGTKNCRDPYLFKGEDGYFYIIATDMDASTNQWWGNSDSMVIWRSKDLVSWGNETIIKMTDILPNDDIQRCWAPQVIYDSQKKQYMVYFSLASGSYTQNGTYIYYCYTSNLLDAKSYSKPQLLFKPADSGAAIDGDIIYNSKNKTYYLYYKDEEKAKICFVKSSNPAGPYNDASNPTVAIKSTLALEGCNSFMLNGTDTLVMLVDSYAEGRFKMYKSTDFENFLSVSDNKNNINDCTPRHGCVLPVTESEYNRLVKSFGY